MVMQFNYKKSNAADLGKTFSQQAGEFYVTNRENSPDFTMIAKEAIKARSNERRAAIAAEAKVASTGLKAMGDVKFEKIDAKTQKEVEAIKAPARRFAGIVAAASTIGGYAVMKKFNDMADAEADKRQQETNKIIQETLGAYNKASEVKPEEPGPPPKMKPVTLETPLTEAPASPDGSSSTPKSLGSTIDSSNSSNGYADPQEVYTYLTKDKGLSHNKALGLIANIQRESSFKLDNPGDNGESNGLLQWNKGRLARMKQHVPDWQTNWKGQLSYALSDKQMPHYAGITKTFLNSTYDTPDLAGGYWAENWEVPADLKGALEKQRNFISTYRFK